MFEECDDGNVIDGDGCSSTCKLEAGYQCDPVLGNCSCKCCGAVQLDTGHVALPTSSNNGYDNDLYCSWIIGTGGQTGLVFRFFNFNTEKRDVVSLASCASAGCPDPQVVANYSGIGPGEGSAVTVGSGYVQVRFRADSCVTGSGFALYWSPHSAYSAGNCGNGVQDALELCDDGNTVANDGCGSFCQLEVGYRLAGLSLCVCVCVRARARARA